MKVPLLLYLVMFLKCTCSLRLGRISSYRPQPLSITGMDSRRVTSTGTWVRQTATALFSTSADTKKGIMAAAAPVADVASIFDIELPTNENNIDLLKIRHSTAHVMAMAVQKVYPEARVTIGPWIDNGCVSLLRFFPSPLSPILLSFFLSLFPYLFT